MDDAVAALLAHAQPVAGHELLDTMAATGRVLAQDLRAPMNVPPHDNSAMDGYALNTADLVAGTALAVSQRIAAGQTGAVLQQGTVARIFTGAPVPHGADAVVMQEACELQQDGAVLVRHRPQPGENIRRAGEDITSGTVLIDAGTLLTPMHLGLAASIGVAQVSVHRRVRVAMFSTGDELRMPGEALEPGQIYNSNRFVLNNLLARMGCAVTDLGIVRDSLEATRTALRAAAVDHDLIMTCGGVSVGEEDHVKPAVQAEGHLDLWSIAIKPGKPLAYGSVRRSDGAGSAHFVGLPGNPVSAFVTLLMVVRPFLRVLSGQPAHAEATGLRLRADFVWPKPDRRREFLRVHINAAGGLDLYPNQGSGVLNSCAWADGLVDNPPAQPIAAGDLVRYLPYASLLA
jgi:molybdopterin molybdotransferase